MTDFRRQHKSITEQLHTIEQRQAIADRLGIFEFDVREHIFEHNLLNWSALLE